jgi:PAS domain S-box-containing protein
VKDAKGQIEQAVITFTDITERKRAEEALRESENLFSRFMDHLPAIVFIKDSENKTQFVNKYMDNALGASKWLGKTVLDFLPTEFAEQLIADDLKTFQLGYQKIEESIPHLDGKLHVYETQKFIIPRSNQAPLLGGISLDITERKQAEEAMVRTLSLLESTMESTADGIMVADGKGAIVKFNAKFGELWGITEAMIAAKDENAAISFVLGQLQEPESFLKTIRDLYAAPEQISFDILALKDGRVFERYSQPQKIGDSIIGRVWSFRDVTARKQAEDALHFSEQKFRTLFENLTEGVALHELVTDAAGQVVDYRLLAVNTAFERHTGLVAATAPGLLATEIYETEVPPYLAEFSQVALGGEPYAFETFFPPLDKHFRISVISPKPGQFATVFEDITDRKRREEELKQKNAEMERFTYMISHDLKSPLVTVRTFLGYLEQDMEQGKADRVAKDMTFIRDATGKMGRLLEDLLEVSRVGRVVNPPVRVSLADLIREALQAVAGAISTRGVAIQVEVPTVTLFGDRPRLEEVWQNLVENAVKYMGDQPAPQIELGVEGAGNDLVFFVRDNGLGIDPRFQDKVFGLFEKLDPATEGTGLGLALVKRIVELYEGRLWLESEGLGHGTCFRFTLPLALKGQAKEQR